jgi:hypothetical protein
LKEIIANSKGVLYPAAAALPIFGAGRRVFYFISQKGENKMAEKTIKNGRIINKHDTEANWNKATGFIPYQGEVIVYDVDEYYSYERFKIGDGVTAVTALPFSSQ